MSKNRGMNCGGIIDLALLKTVFQTCYPDQERRKVCGESPRRIFRSHPSRESLEMNIFPTRMLLVRCNGSQRNATVCLLLCRCNNIVISTEKVIINGDPVSRKSSSVIEVGTEDVSDYETQLIKCRSSFDSFLRATFR